MIAHYKKIENILKLDTQERFDYFVRKIADFETIWGLFYEGWATAASQEKIVIPFWPEEDFATLCANAEWEGYAAKPIKMDEFLSRWLPGMQDDDRMCQIFPTPEKQGFLIQPAALLKSIKEELEQYE